MNQQEFQMGIQISVIQKLGLLPYSNPEELKG